MALPLLLPSVTSEVHMKTILLLSLMLPMMAQAKVSDFNALIEENQTAQKALYGEVKSKVEANRLALEETQTSTVLADSNTNTGINVPTDKNFMRFKKELLQQQASEKNLQERLSHEMQSEGLQF